MRLNPGIPSGRHARRRVRIEIVPLIDIVFFLLATFVMVSLSMVKNQGISVKLPVAATVDALPRDTPLTVSIDRDGLLFLNKSAIALADLIAVLSQAKQSEPEVRVFINADGEARFQLVVTVLDEIRKLGISRIALETQKQLAAPDAANEGR